MVELVDTTDLNSVDPNGSCGFKSRSGYDGPCNAELQGFFVSQEPSRESPLGWVCLPHLKLSIMRCVSLLFLALVMLLLNGCQTTSPVVESPEVERTWESGLFEMMQGSFDSKAQAAEDSAYYAISLHMYPIWPERGQYLYVEQALAAMQDKPYRQRVYELRTMGEGVVESHVYKIPADSLWVGKWSAPEAFEALSLSDLEHLEGCEVRLTQVGEGHFSGSTGDQTCPSVLYGASYAQSQVDVKPDRVESWDRGFDAEGNHIWGAEKGGYIFLRQTKN